MQQPNPPTPKDVPVRFAAWSAVLLAGLLVLTGWAVRTSWNNQNAIAQEQFEQKFELLEAGVRAQFHPIGNGIHGLMGLYAANRSTQAGAFGQWVASHDLAEQYPGVRQFGLIERKARAPADTYRTQGAATVQEHMLVRLVAPAGLGQSLAGLDIAPSSPVQVAIQQAIDFGDPVLTRTDPSSGDSPEWGSDFLYLRALYTQGPEPQSEEERRQRLVGVLFASLALEKLLLEAAPITEGLLDFEVFDGSETNARTLLFSTLNPLGTQQGSVEPTDFSPRHLQFERRMWMDGRVLLLRAASNPVLESRLDHTRPKLIAAIGALLSVLLTWFVAAALKSRERSRQLTSRLSQNMDRLAHIVQTTHHVVITGDTQGRIAWVNEAFTQVTGKDPLEVVGQDFASVVPVDVTAPGLHAKVQEALATHQALRQPIAWKTASGETRWYDLDLQPEVDGTGAFNGYIAIAADITHQHAAHEGLQIALRENQQMLEAIDNHSIVSITDSAGTITYANDMFVQISGYSREELLGNNHRIVKSSAQPEGFWDEVWKTIASGYSWRATVGNRAKNGTIYWVDTAITPFFDERGNIVKYVSIRSDVTAARQAQADLRQNNLVMHSILENIPVALSAVDRDLNLIASNQKFQELLDFPAKLFEGPVTTFESLIRFNAERGEYGQYNVEQTVQAIVERARHTTVHQFERLRPGGLALEVRGAPMPGGGFITTYADITARKNAEAEIQRTTNMLQSVLDSASEVAVITMDLDHTITLFNRGAERLLGYTAQEAIGHLKPTAFFNPAEIQARCSALSHQTGRSIQGLEVILDASVLGKRTEWTYVRRDGHRFSAVIVVTELTDATGLRVGYLSVSHDITQEKEHEAQLQIAMEEAEQAALAKGQFLANMSHEIRTPMNAILGMLKLLQNTALDARQHDYTGKAESAAKALLGLLNDILDFSKSEAGKMQLDPQPFRLDQLMRDLSVILSANVGGRSIEVLFDVDARLPATLVGDSLRLQQILINLSGNAIKFTDQGEVVVSLTQVHRTPDAVTLRVAVRDSGIGIDPKHQQHIFAGFSQAEASTTRRFGGTGLGLSICKRLVALMDSEMMLESALGKGSTFHFTLTLPMGAQDEPAGPLPTQATGATPSTTTKVLVVDDNPCARKILSSMAQDLGWSVETVGSGAQALQHLHYRNERGDAPFQAVFIDWQMPEMDGWDTARRIRAFAAQVDGPLICMVSAYGRDMLEHKSQSEPNVIDGFVIKPATTSMLLQSLHDAHDHQRNPQRQANVLRTKSTPLSGVRLLVVEDNLINQQVARELLSAEGALVDIAGNGQIGVDAVANASPPYDAVLMDLQMPVMDGYTAAVAIRNELGLTELPIIAMTANAMASDREACLTAGMNDHIGKPFDIRQLVALLLQHVQRTGKSDAAAPPSPPPLPTPLPAPPPPSVNASDAEAASATTALLDTAAARNMLGNNDELYVQISEAYLTEIGSLPQRIDDLLLRGGLLEANRLLHTIKGLSLTVGALRLSSVCKAGEFLLKACITAQSPLAPATANELRAKLRNTVMQTTDAILEVLSAYKAHAPAQEQPGQPRELDAECLVRDLEELERLLLQSDLSALDAHAALRSRHVPAAGTQLDALEKSIKALDFAQGVVQCQSLKREFSTHPRP